MTKADAQYAINEMFARHGAAFAKQDTRRQFELYSWYRPHPGVALDEIEKRFTFIENRNLQALAKYRDSKPGRD